MKNIVLAAALLAAATTASLASEADPIVNNRYPVAASSLQSAQVSLQGRAHTAPVVSQDSSPLISGGGY